MTATTPKRLSVDPQIAVISDSAVEIRYETNPRILDTRGKAAENIQLRMKFDSYRIGPDAIQIHKLDDSESVFLTTSNLGYFAREAKGAGTVAGRAKELFSYACSEKLFREQKNIPVRRVGARLKALTPVSGNFVDLKNRIAEVFGTPSQGLKDIISGTLSDVGYTYDFKDAEGQVRIQVGPMRDEQIIKFFERPDDHELPAVGLYLDVDVFKELTLWSADSAVEQTIGVFANKSWAINKSIVDLIFTG